MTDSAASESGTRNLWLFRTLLFLILALLLVLGAEGIARIFAPSKPIRPAYANKTDRDSLIGWRPKSHLSIAYDIYPAKNTPKRVFYETGPWGARVWGDTTAKKPRLLILGDSYTQAVEVSNPDLYAQHLAEELEEWDVYCIGQAGYGTLQELLLLEEIFPLLKPDMVLLQVCDNDMLDNHLELEKAALYSTKLPRPYLRPTGKTEIHSTRIATSPWEKRSALVAWWMGMRRKRKPKLPAEKIIAQKGQAYPLYAEALDLTRQLLGHMQSLTENESKLLIFNASHYIPQSKDFKQMCQDLQIPYTEKPALAVKKAGRKARARDGFHWNERGHKIIAKSLVPWLTSHIPTSSTKD